MACKIKSSKRFEVNVAKTYEYILDEFGPSVADEFLAKLYQKLHTLQSHPFIGRVTKKRPNIRRVQLEPYNIIYYRIDENTIALVNFRNSKRNPKQNPYD
ncbi:MAG TPA: type II toxin-antitoxin system RelE/ParE family toxin [Niastella sp.]